MRATVYVATSLDGFIAREDGALDWLTSADPGEADLGFDEFLASVDAFVMGRKTFDFVIETGMWVYGDKPVFVLTHRELDLPGGFPGRAEALAMSADSLTIELSRRGFEHLYVDGGATIHSFLRAGLIQRIIITRLPILIGSGIPLFGGLESDISLRLHSSTAFENGWIQDVYEVLS